MLELIKLHGVMCQKTVFFIAISLWTLDLNASHQ